MLTLKVPGRERVHGLSLSADGAKLAMVTSTEPQFWAADRAAGLWTRVLPPDGMRPDYGSRCHVAVRPDGAVIVVNMWLSIAATGCGGVAQFVHRDHDALSAGYDELSYSPDGRELWAACDGRVRRWDADTWQPLPPWAVDPAPRWTRVTPCATGRVLIVVNGLPGGTRYRQTVRATDGVFGASSDPVVTDVAGSHVVSRDGSRVAVFDTRVQRLEVVDTTAPASLWRITAVKGAAFLCAAFSADARTLYAGCGPLVRVFDADTGTERAALDWKAEKITALAVAADGLTAAAGTATGRVVVWDTV